MIEVLECLRCTPTHIYGFVCSECRKQFSQSSQRFKFCPECGSELGDWKEALKKYNIANNSPLDSRFRIEEHDIT